MKKNFLLIVSFCAGLTGSAQNPFAKQTFYDAFKKVYADGQKGFIETTGMFRNEVNSFYSFHLPKTLLPGADSGRVALPLSIGSPFVSYYFSPSKKLTDAKLKEKNLHEAIRTAWGNPPLVEVKRTDTVKQFIFYKTLFYKNRDDIKNYLFVLDTYIVFENGVYQLTLNVNGINAPSPAKETNKGLPAEPELDNKIKALMTSIAGQFADEKNRETSRNEYYIMYESRTLFYGQKCKVKDRQFEASFNFYAGYPELGSPAEAKSVYDKLKEAFSRTGRFTFNQEIKEGSRTYIFGAENISGQRWKTSSFSVVIEYYASSETPSVSFLLTSKKLSKP